jgi:hypothetical protein
MAIRAPVRAWFVVTPALNGTTTVHVHVIFLDIPFTNRGQCIQADRQMADGGEFATEGAIG